MPKGSSQRGPKPTAARRMRERAVRRQMILAAAKSTIAERGFLNATMEEIAAQCELAVGTLYRYFQSKEELYVSLLFEGMDVLEQYTETTLNSGAPPDEQLRATWRFFYDFYREQPEHYHAIMFLHNEGVSDAISPEVIDQVNRRAGWNFRLVSEIVQAGMDAGIYRDDLDPRGVAEVMWSTLIGLVHLIETRRNLGAPADMLETLHREAFEWLECGLRR